MQNLMFFRPSLSKDKQNGITILEDSVELPKNENNNVQIVEAALVITTENVVDDENNDADTDSLFEGN